MSVVTTNLRGVGSYYDPEWNKVTLLLQAIAAGPVVTDRSNSNLGTLTKANPSGTNGYNNTGARWGMAGVSMTTSFFDGLVTVNSSAVDVIGSGPWCIDGRVTVHGLPPSSYEYALFWTGNTISANISSGTGHFALTLQASGRLRFGYWNGSSRAYVETVAAVPTGADAYIRVAHSGTTLTVQINAAVETFSITPVRPAAQPLLCIGWGANHNGMSSGALGTTPNFTLWSLRVTKGSTRSSWIGHRNLPFPVHKGTANIYVPGAGQPSDPNAPKGQWTTTAPATWTVPEGVSSVSIVCIGMRARIGALMLVRAETTALDGDMVGAGGAAGDRVSYTEQIPNPDYSGGGTFGGGSPSSPYITVSGQRDGGGGGAGGYGAAGGKGGDVSNRPNGAGAGGRNQPSDGTYAALPGQGASLLGINPGGGTLYGGGPVNQRGNALAARNSISVGPGQVITFEYADGAVGTCAARVMWGGVGRAYPYNAGDI